MTGKCKAVAVLALIAAATGAIAGSAQAAEDDAIVIGQWRTETTKSLVCGGGEFAMIVTAAKRANAYYLSGAKQSSPEFEAYWPHLEKAFKERRCFVSQNMRHLPDALLHAGPENLEASNKRFKVLGTTIEEDGERFPAFTLTTRRMRR